MSVDVIWFIKNNIMQFVPHQLSPQFYDSANYNVWGNKHFCFPLKSRMNINYFVNQQIKQNYVSNHDV